MADYWQELTKKLGDGPYGPPVPVTPGPKEDYWEGLNAQLRSERLGGSAKPTKEDPKGFVLPTPGWGMGMSVGNGMLQGFLPEIAGLAGTGGLLEGGGIPPDTNFAARYEQNINRLKAAREDYGKENSGKALVGELGGSMATLIPAMAAGAGVLAPLGAGIARAAPWAAGLVDFLSGAGGGAMRLPSLAARGAAEGAEGAALSSGLSEKPLGEQVRTGAGIGALVNPVVGGIASKLGSHVNATTADTAQALLDQGVPVRAGQIPGSNKIAQGLDKVFGGGNAQQREAFGEKLTGYAGLPEKEISQGWVAKNDQRVGKVMNDIQSVYSLPKGGDIDTHIDLARLRLSAHDNLSNTNAAKVNSAIDQIEGNLAKGVNGNIYKNITQQNGLLHNLGKDVDIAQFVNSHTGLPGGAKSLRETLDDAWGRALPADKKEAWDTARREYRVTRTIDDTMGASGAAEGVYNPKALLKGIEKRFGNVENAGDLGMLARGGQFLEPPGAAPASAKHGTAKMVGNMALGGAAAVAASEGSKVITHMGPEAIAALTQHPESYALPLLLAAGLYGGAKAGNAALNGPRATQYLLDVSRGSRNPLLMGNNPMLPMLVEGYNRQ